jgi:hypothetical protein
MVFDLHAGPQEPDSLLVADTVPEEVHSPKKATIYSAILPGLGQAYNKKYWKIPVIYMGFGTIGYYIGWNNDKYQFNKTAYRHLVDQDPETNLYEKIEAIKYYDLNNPTHFENFKDGLIKRQDYYRRNRDLLIISIIGFYGLNIIDASVDAHLFDFDISDDLTMKWSPKMVNLNNDYFYCVNFIFNF